WRGRTWPAGAGPTPTRRRSGRAGSGAPGHWPARWPRRARRLPFCCQGRPSAGAGAPGGGGGGEPPPPRPRFLPRGVGGGGGVVREWEAAARQAEEAGIRVVTMRSGVVMSRRGGVLARLLPPFRLGLGARLGPGTQVMSWITLADYAAIVSFLLTHPEITGPVNLTTPHPVTNAEFTAALAAAVHRPGLLFLPERALKLALGGVSSAILATARATP